MNQMETRYVGGRFLYRLKGQTIWHSNRADAQQVVNRVM